MSNHWLYISNWKSYLPYKQELALLQQNLTALKQLALELESQDKTLVICPSFVTLAQAAELLNSEILKPAQDIPIQLGAQNCSATQLGAYTGEISVDSLQQLGCNYCLVGHFERRKLYHETDLEIAAKIKLLIQAQITPVICISEIGQLAGLLNNINLESLSNLNLSYPKLSNSEQANLNSQDLLAKNLVPRIIIAYEPTWAIGTGKTPTVGEITQFCQALKVLIQTRFSEFKNYVIIYGGSVTANNITELRQITELNGVLIGKASINFQELKKIVLS